MELVNKKYAPAAHVSTEHSVNGYFSFTVKIIQMEVRCRWKSSIATLQWLIAYFCFSGGEAEVQVRSGAGTGKPGAGVTAAFKSLILVLHLNREIPFLRGWCTILLSTLRRALPPRDYGLGRAQVLRMVNSLGAFQTPCCPSLSCETGEKPGLVLHQVMLGWSRWINHNLSLINQKDLKYSKLLENDIPRGNFV